MKVLLKIGSMMIFLIFSQVLFAQGNTPPKIFVVKIPLTQCNGQCAYIGEINPNGNYGNYVNFTAGKWTWDSKPAAMRSLIQFDLTSIPSNAVILSAKLVLKANPPGSGFPSVAYAQPNGLVFKPLLTTWSENTVTWSSSPTVGPVMATHTGSLANGILLPSDNITVDVTTLIKAQKLGNNFGMMMQLVDESQHYKIRSFGSDDGPAAKVPVLEITFN